MSMFRFRASFVEGPLDGHVQESERPGLEPDIAVQDPATGLHHHYALADMPDVGGDEPYELRYRWVSEFDPESDYFQQVADVRARQLGGET